MAFPCMFIKNKMPMRKIKNFVHWYLRENSKYYVKCMEKHINPFLP